jgi:choice-of-anchor A domain-containing protein
MNTLSSTLGAESGTALTISGGGQTINASDGTVDGSGNEVFTVAANSFNLQNGITINGTASQYVVINIDNGTANEKINGAVNLTGGITSDHVLFNFVGTGGELGGSANKAVANGIFLAPNMKVNIDSVTIDGRLIGGGSSTSNNDFKIVSNAYVVQPNVPVPSTLVMLSIMSGMVGMVWSYRRLTATKVAA